MPTATTRSSLLKQVAAKALSLSDLEREMLAYLLGRPDNYWCPGCDRVLLSLAAQVGIEATLSSQTTNDV